MALVMEYVRDFYALFFHAPFTSGEAVLVLFSLFCAACYYLWLAVSEHKSW
jgi:hypothetical protein